MNIHYIQLPTDYIGSLKRNGESEKARAFMEYFYDLQIIALEEREPNSVRYYAKSWGSWIRGKSEKPKSNSVVVKWIDEFTLEIDKYYASWSLVNSRNTARVKNSSGRKPKERLKNKERTPKSTMNADITASTEPKRTLKERQKNEEYNLNDDDKTLRRDYNNLYFIFRAFNGSYAGSKEDGLIAYRDISNDLPYKEMEKAIKLYFADKRVVKKCGISKFFKNTVYVDYTTKRVSILVDGRWVDGSYLGENFLADNGQEMILSAEGFAKFFSDDKVRLLDLEEDVA